MCVTDRMDTFLLTSSASTVTAGARKSSLWAHASISMRVAVASVVATKVVAIICIVMLVASATNSAPTMLSMNTMVVYACHDRLHSMLNFILDGLWEIVWRTLAVEIRTTSSRHSEIEIQV